MIIRVAERNPAAGTLNRRFGYDVRLLVLAIGLCVIGSVFVLTASAAYSWRWYHHDPFAVFRNHLLRLAIGLVFMVVLAFTDYRLLKSLARLIVVAAVLSLIGVLFVPLPEKVTAHRWYYLPGFNVQPAEFAKLALIFYLSARFSALRDEARCLNPRRVFSGGLIVTAVLLGLVLLEPNLSMAVLIMAVAAGMYFLAEVSTKAIAVIGAAGAVPLALVAWLTPYMRTRIEAFINGIADPTRAVYQVKQSVIGIGHGGAVGVGLGESTQKYFFLPEPHKDFIFSIVGEELGLAGALVVLILFVLLFARGLRIAKQAPDWFGYYLATGITISLAASLVVNVAVTLCLLPPTGQPLPLVSYGGSSLIMTLSAIGILLNISRHANGRTPGTAAISEYSSGY